MESVQSLIKKQLIKNEGQLVFPDDFSQFGSIQAVLMALSRLVKENELVRLAQGIYLRPKYDSRLGMLTPSIEEIAQAIAKRDQVIIRPTGAYALNKLGISNQVPMKVVFLTNGHPKSIKIGKGKLIFKMTSPKNLAAKNETVFLVSQSIQSLQGNINSANPIYQKLIKALSQIPPKEIRENAKYAPQKITRMLYQMADQIESNDTIFAATK